MARTLNGWTFTDHADERRIQMRLTSNDVLEAVSDPEVTYCSPSYPGTLTLLHGDLAVAVDEHEPVIITVLWRGNFEGRDANGDPVPGEVSA